MIPQEKKLLDLLSNNDVTFFIPPYQRNYEWSDEQCKVFLDDVYKTYNCNLHNDKKEHFFGSITFFQSETAFGQPNRLVLIDGQQRITTTMLFLVALRDIIDDITVKKYIDSKYLKNNNVDGDSEYKIKLKQVETDWNVYKSIILSEEILDHEKDSAVYRNYQFFKNRLEQDIATISNIGSLVELGISKFSVITIELQPHKNSWENPQEIFESMNSLGKPLTLADLVRNYLLLGLDADSQTELYNKYWLHIEKTVPKRVSDFIRDFMQGITNQPYPKATETNYKILYGNFKTIFDGYNSKKLLKELSEYSSIYAYIVFGTSTGSKAIDSLLSDIRRGNITTAYSFLLILLHEWEKGKLDEHSLIDILDSFKIYCYRRRLISLTQTENKAFPILTERIPELILAENKKLKMFEILSHQENRMRLPNDIEIMRHVETMDFYNFSYCKLFLSLVEEKLTKSRPNLDDSKLQIEHIMPQTLNDKWKEALGEDFELIHQEYVNNIGNLTLIRHNQELGQKPFIEKKHLYDNNAGLQIARTKITDNKHWDKKSITKRAKWIIGFILDEVLPIPTSMRKTNNFSLKAGKKLSFSDLNLIGHVIHFTLDTTITAKVVSDNEVEFEGLRWKLSPLTREIQTRRGALNNSGVYSGAHFWSYDGTRLTDLM